MTSIKVLLPDLPSNSKFHETRVKVVSKTRPTQSPGKMFYQRVVLRDEVGNTMRLCLFGADVSVYDQIFSVDKLYDILNVTIKEERPDSPYARGKSMYVSNSTVIKPVDVQPEGTLFQGRYMNIRTAIALESMDETFDLVCVVVDVTDMAPQRTNLGTMVDMAKFHVTDDSYSALIDVALWGTNTAYVDTFKSHRNAEGVVSFEGLRKSSFGGKTTFTTTSSCVVKLQPQGPRVDELKSCHQKDIEAAIEDSGLKELEDVSEEVENIAECLKRKADEVTVGKTLQFVATIDDFSDTSVRTSSGCNRCGRACNLAVGERFLCASCKRPTTCVAKLYFDFTVRDTTGTLALHAPTRATERILGITAHAYYMETLEGRSETLNKIRPIVCKTPRAWIVTLVASLLEHNRNVKWMFKYFKTAT